MVSMKTPLFFSLLGTLLLLFLSNNLEPKLSEINDIKISNIDNFVKINGEIASIKEFESTMIINVKDDSDKINVVLFEKAQLSNGMQVEIIGKVSEFNNEVQINAERISIKK